MRVVQVALVIVAEDLVRLGDFLELDLGLLALILGDLVGVVAKSRLERSVSDKVLVEAWCVPCGRPS